GRAANNRAMSDPSSTRNVRRARPPEERPDHLSHPCFNLPPNLSPEERRLVELLLWNAVHEANASAALLINVRREYPNLKSIHGKEQALLELSDKYPISKTTATRMTYLQGTYKQYRDVLLGADSDQGEASSR